MPQNSYTDPRRQVEYSPPSSTSYNEPYDRRDRNGGALQPYSNGRRDRNGGALQPYSDGRRNEGPRSQRSYDDDDYDYPPRPVRRRRSDSHLAPSQTSSKSKEGEAWFKDHGAGLLGAAAGGLAGHKKGNDHLQTAGGAAVGAIGAQIFERQYRKWNDKREDKKIGRDARRGGGEYESEPYRARSVGGRGRSVDRNRDREPRGWKDVGRQIQRSLSRKRGRDARSDYSDRSR